MSRISKLATMSRMFTRKTGLGQTLKRSLAPTRSRIRELGSISASLAARQTLHSLNRWTLMTENLIWRTSSGRSSADLRITGPQKSTKPSQSSAPVASTTSRSSNRSISRTDLHLTKKRRHRSPGRSHLARKISLERSKRKAVMPSYGPRRSLGSKRASIVTSPSMRTQT